MTSSWERFLVIWRVKSPGDVIYGAAATYVATISTAGAMITGLALLGDVTLILRLVTEHFKSSASDKASE
jgi:uncharacterized BrkB/YihY/UPF0761 family membrane protein